MESGFDADNEEDVSVWYLTPEPSPNDFPPTQRSDIPIDAHPLTQTDSDDYDHLPNSPSSPHPLSLPSPPHHTHHAHSAGGKGRGGGGGGKQKSPFRFPPTAHTDAATPPLPNSPLPPPTTNNTSPPPPPPPSQISPSPSPTHTTTSLAPGLSPLPAPPGKAAAVPTNTAASMGSVTPQAAATTKLQQLQQQQGPLAYCLPHTHGDQSNNKKLASSISSSDNCLDAVATATTSSVETSSRIDNGGQQLSCHRHHNRDHEQGEVEGDLGEARSRPVAPVTVPLPPNDAHHCGHHHHHHGYYSHHVRSFSDPEDQLPNKGTGEEVDSCVSMAIKTDVGVATGADNDNYVASFGSTELVSDQKVPPPSTHAPHTSTSHRHHHHHHHHHHKYHHHHHHSSNQHRDRGPHHRVGARSASTSSGGGWNRLPGQHVARQPRVADIPPQGGTVTRQRHLSAPQHSPAPQHSSDHYYSGTTTDDSTTGGRVTPDLIRPAGATKSRHVSSSGHDSGFDTLRKEDSHCSRQQTVGSQTSHQQRNTSLTPPILTHHGTLVEVTLVKDPTLGLGITGGHDSENGCKPGDPGFHVFKVLDGTPAHKSGLILIGDKILEINGTDISSMRNQEAISLLTGPEKNVSLLLYREPSETML